MDVIGRIARELTPEVQRGMFETLKRPEVQKEAASQIPVIIGQFTSGESRVSVGQFASAAIGILCLFSTWYFSNDIRKQLPLINKKLDQTNEKFREREGRMEQFIIQREEEVQRFFSAIDRVGELQSVLTVIHTTQNQLIERQKHVSTRHFVYLLALQGELRRQNQIILDFRSLFEEMKGLLREAIERREQIDEGVKNRLNAAERHYDRILGNLSC